MNKVSRFLEESFLRPLLQDSAITDVSYNGESIYFVSNEYGRSFFRKVDEPTIMAMLRQIANMTNHQFSYQKPILDVSFDNYRLSAVHPSIGRVHYEDGCSFSLRIAPKIPIDLELENMINDEIKAIFAKLLSQNRSIIISGATGVGKTELQKYMLSLLPLNSRVIVIDNVQELGILQEQLENIDLTIWEINEDKDNANLPALVRTALRFNPDYILIAESRGPEMADIYNASLTGHPTIITIHSRTSEEVYNRLYQMGQEVFKKMSFEDALTSLKETFPYVIFLRKRKNETGQIIRYINKINAYEEGEIKTLYEQKK